VDFEHQRREEVIHLPPPAMTAPPLPPLSSATRSAVRDVGKPWAL
jgi:hypothetical protein